MKTAIVREAPARYGVMKVPKPVLRNENSMWLHDVTPATFKRLAGESGVARGCKLSYQAGDVEISGFTGSGVVLPGITWETYNRLVDETGDERKTRFAYSDGELEIMVPLDMHEGSNRPFETLLLVLAKGFGMKLKSYGELTCRRPILQKGMEPDSCFYLTNAAHFSRSPDIRLDLEKDPPPDLMLEVDVTNFSDKKLGICAALGVPEHWRYIHGKLEIRILEGSAYVLSDQSRIFPGLPLTDAIPRFIRLSWEKDVVEMFTQFSAWLRAELRKSNSERSPRKKRK